ncbi:leucine--tRNA ligase [Cardinium endosymbiont of Nabis limbatus]|uniref:leucine--tRNA ligase n=1 Tax=Cardinium endosymbiont of Nabis limbatus TaxID=3066217 RepID=UPI003AF3D344
MRAYNFTLIEEKWRSIWKKQLETIPHEPLQYARKYYILNMFPYPSGSGLHVGHHTGYVASDIIARYYRHKGYHVMNPMGFDAFGLPAEQYAIQTGQHPAITTEKNVNKYKKQFQQIGLYFDWDRQINTSEPTYYKWTQWIFLQLFNSWYNNRTQKAEPIETLIQAFINNGNHTVEAVCDEDTPLFSAQEWNSFTASEQQAKLLHYRLAYLRYSMVNWCEALGTVLANEEVKNGFSEIGSYPVTRKKMKQWSLRITAYAERLLEDLTNLDWPLSTKEMQRNWIGRSEGAEIIFSVLSVQGKSDQIIKVFTTRPETIFGACFIVLAPEHPFVNFIADTTGDTILIDYIHKARNQPDRNRLAESIFLTGIFLDAYAIHPFTGAKLPIWVADYVLPSYGTGAVMGVPAHNSRDYLFAQSFKLPSLSVIKSDKPLEDGRYEATEGTLINSSFLNGLSVPMAFANIIQELVRKKIGKYKINYKVRDPIFSRQRYWGEPFPIYYKEDGLPYALSEDQLPLVLPEVSSYQPNKSGEPPLSNALNWTTPEGYPLELTTMPGWAGSSWYFLRYMDAHNANAFVSKREEEYWNPVDFYIGGAEHATGHLLYARFWTKVLHDLGYIRMKEPFHKLFHQGMILNFSALAYRIKDKNEFVSFHLKASYDVVAIHVPIKFVHKHILDIEALKKWRPEFADATFILEDGKYICGSKIEKMSKSKHNVVNQDTVIAQYGADALRLYLMFLGPLEESKPWDLAGIEGCSRFLHKVWRFVHYAQDSWTTTECSNSKEITKTMHQTIQKVTEAIQKCSFNTAVSSLMICLNKLSAHSKVEKSIVEKFILLLEPFAPYIAAELWESIGKGSSIRTVSFPDWDEAYLVETNYAYPVAINGKIRTKIIFDCNTPDATIEKEVLIDTIIQKWLSGKTVKKVIIIHRKMINIVA